jgi:hypothetical protein
MPNDRLGTSYTDADALRDVFGGSSSGGSTGVYSDIDALRGTCRISMKTLIHLQL